MPFYVAGIRFSLSVIVFEIYDVIMGQFPGFSKLFNFDRDFDKLTLSMALSSMVVSLVRYSNYELSYDVIVAQFPGFS